MFEVLNYIHEHITEMLNAAEVAACFGYSRWYFCKKFHEYTNTTFHEYVRRYRIQLAAIEILQGKKVSDVAFDYGYGSIGGFNKAFVKEYGCFPKEYRKQAAESQLYYERRKADMYSLSDRCSELREEMVNRKSYVDRYCLQRTVYFLLGAARAADDHLAQEEIVAAGMVNVLEQFTPFIIPGELIVGFNFGDAQYGDQYLPEETEENIALMRKNHISEEEIRQYYRLPRHFRNYGRLFGTSVLEDCKEEFDPIELESRKERATHGRCICNNHSVIGYEKVLKLGFEGLLKEVEHYEAQNGANPLYRGMKAICQSALAMGQKYAAEAERLLETEDPAYRREDLEKIIQICRRVPRYPAGSFAEAVQAIWFAHILNTWEDTINANSVGRLDQILYPYYKADLEKGILTREEAYELLGCLWLKLYRDYDVQQSCVGGTNPDGTSAVNELSYMMLDITEGLDFVRCLSVRFSEKTEKEFVKRALEVVGHVQKGVPFFFNDDVMIPALLAKGMEPEDAYNYTQLGCVETVIPGKSNPHAVSGETNFLKAIEYTLCNGHSMMYPQLSPGVATGSLNTLDTYDKFYDCALKQIERILELTCSQVDKNVKACVAPKPYKSLLTEGCLESGRDFNDKGAKYDYYQIMFGGIPNLADSLLVIKKLVYQERKYSLEQLKEILEQNYPEERIRMEFLNKVSKFGNDIEEVDEIAVALTEFACDVLDKLSVKYGYDFHAQPFTYLWMIDYGANSAASPDGRRAGEPVAYSVSPMQGRDFNGLTAVLNSIAKFPTKRTPGTTSAIVEVDPKLFTDRNIGVLTDILIASAGKGLSNVQFNTVDADTLLAAQKYPEKYNNLAVRVSGFSQKFNLLNPQLQDHIIGRTKHACL